MKHKTSEMTLITIKDNQLSPPADHNYTDKSKHLCRNSYNLLRQALKEDEKNWLSMWEKIINL